MNPLKIKLTRAETDRISQILSDIGIVIAAAVILPSILSELNIPRIIVGSMFAIFFWLISIKISKIWTQ